MCLCPQRGDMGMIRCTGQNNSQEHGDSTQRSNRPDVQLESLTPTPYNNPIVNNQHNDQSSQSGYREGNSNDTGKHTQYAFCYCQA